MRLISVVAFGQWLNDTRSAGPVTLLLGSAISGASGLPTGQRVGTLLADLLAANIPTGSLVHRLVKDTAFEHIMEACPRPSELRRAVADIYNKDLANDCHHAIARLVGSGAVRHVVTTNYDLCLENAFRSSAIQRVVKPEDLDYWKPDQPTYFKIHGCASDPDSLVFTLSGEPALVKWKKDLLAHMVTGHRLVVVGYSGLDFEICPELRRLRPTLAWVCYEAPRAHRPYYPSPGGISVLQMDTSTAVQGDMHEAVARLGTTRPAISSGTSVALPDDVFEFGTSEDEKARNLDLWRCQLFRAIGCARAAGAAAKRLMRLARTDAERATAHHYVGLAAFHAGKYRRAGQAYRAAAALIPPPDNNGYLFDAVIADRCVGLYEQALETLEALSVQAPQFRPQLLLRRLEFLASRYESARARGKDGEAQRIQAEALPLTQELAASSDRPGARFEHQQSDLLARRLEISAEVSAVDYSPPPSRDGFSQLGYFVAAAMAVRQDLIEGTDLPEFHDALSMFADLDEMGAAAEAWKFGLALVARHRGHAGYRVLVRTVLNYARCEYTLQQRKELLTQLIGRAKGSRVR